MKRWRIVVRIGLVMLLTGLVASCKDRTPVKIGFVGGISGRVADLGVGGRNGATLAIEQRNAAGGINGRSIELVVRDDEQDPEVAKRVVAELIREKVELIIGPMTSSMAMAMMPQIQASKTLLLSPTVTTVDLKGKDDHFFRVISDTADYAGKSARYQFEKLGYRTARAIYDVGNKSYTESWYKDFQSVFEGLGGRMHRPVTYTSSSDAAFLPLVQELLATSPDLVLVIANTVDAALICQQVRKLNTTVAIAIAEWGATERLIELGGRATEGVIISQFLNHNDTSASYRDFRTAYRKRFSQEPGFAGLAGYDATQVALAGLAHRTPGGNIKDAILAKRTFTGVQQIISIDQYGDADRKTFITRINNGAYETLE
jgi:branched-chain amino acid transport system substrate-binding protein